MSRINLFGNILIALGAAGIIFTFWPVLLVYLPQPAKGVVRAADSYLAIPKIGATAPLVFGVDPFTKSAYLKALEYGVAQARGTSRPGQPGTMFIFAHSSDAPWRLTRYNTIFLRLGELSQGDQITITDKGKIYTYQVFDKKVVWPTEVQYLTAKENQLILQTCTPIGTDLQRLLVFAKPV